MAHKQDQVEQFLNQNNELLDSIQKTLRTVQDQMLKQDVSLTSLIGATQKGDSRIPKHYVKQRSHSDTDQVLKRSSYLTELNSSRYPSFAFTEDLAKLEKKVLHKMEVLRADYGTSVMGFTDLEESMNAFRNSFKEEIKSHIETYMKEQKKDLEEMFMDMKDETLKEMNRNFSFLQGKTRRDLGESTSTMVNNAVLEAVKTITATNNIHHETLMNQLESSNNSISNEIRELSSFLKKANFPEAGKEHKALVDSFGEMKRKLDICIRQIDTQTKTLIDLVQQKMSDMTKKMEKDNQINTEKLYKEISLKQEEANAKLSDINFHVAVQRKEVKSIQEKSKESIELLRKTNRSLKVGGDFHKLLVQESQALMDQMIAESNSQVKATQRSSYTCDFHVTNLTLWENTGKTQFSRLWYIPQAETYFKAEVIFTTAYRIVVLLANGRHPSVLGQKPSKGVSLSYTATLIHLKGGDHWKLEKDQDWSASEDQIADGQDGWVRSSGVVSFRDLSIEDIRRKKFVSEDKILFRFEISDSSFRGVTAKHVRIK